MVIFPCLQRKDFKIFYSSTDLGAGCSSARSPVGGALQPANPNGFNEKNLSIFSFPAVRASADPQCHACFMHVVALNYMRV